MAIIESGTVPAKFGSANYGTTAAGIAGFPWGQCTWYCYGRAKEKTGVALSVRGNGGQWYGNVTTGSRVSKKDASYGAVSNSIAVFSGPSSAGHVVFVEEVDSYNVYYTEANVGGTDGIVKFTSKDNFQKKYGSSLTGYIVIR